MASPFSLFRRHQGILLAVFGVALMVAFVVLPAVIQMQGAGGGRGGYNTDTVLVWSGGEVTQSDVNNIRQRRRHVFDFVRNLQNIAKAKPGGDDMNVTREYGMIEQLSNNTASSAVESMLLAQKGRDMGMSINDQAVRNFLKSATDDIFNDDEELDAAIRASIKGTSQAAVYVALKEELLAYHVRQMALKGISPTNQQEARNWAGTVTTPSAAWEYYNRMNRMVNAEFVAIETEDFVAEVGEPTSKQIQSYYDEYKNAYPNPDNPKPGFKVPRKVAFAYIEADFNEFLAEEKEKVTQQQISEYYEENKESFKIDPVSPVDEFDLNDPRSDLPSPPVVPEDEQPPADPGEGEDNPDPPSDGGMDVPPEDATDGTEGADPETNEDSTSDTDQPDATETSGGGCQDETVEEADEGEAGSTSDDNGAAEDAGTDDGETSEDDLTLPEPEYRPLEEVEDQIRAAIASPLAEQRMTEAMAKAREALDAHYDAVIDFDTEISSEDPGAFDGKSQAKKLNLKHGEFDLIDRRSLIEAADDHEIAQSSQRRGQSSEFFVNIVFKTGLPNYQPIESQVGGREKVYLAWKTDEVEAFVPELDDIRDDVVSAWKTEQARELARQAAEELADGLDGNQPLSEQLSSQYEVVTPAQFSYFDPISVLMMRFRGQPPRLARIEEVREGESEDDEPTTITIEDESNEAIKRVVVQMPVGDIRVVPDSGKATYYIVRLASVESTPQEARDQFMQSVVDNQGGDGPPFDLLFVGRSDKLRLFGNWYEELEEEYEVQQIDPEFFQGG